MGKDGRRRKHPANVQIQPSDLDSSNERLALYSDARQMSWNKEGQKCQQFHSSVISFYSRITLGSFEDLGHPRTQCCVKHTIVTFKKNSKDSDTL